jgi:hypothetical protein
LAAFPRAVLDLLLGRFPKDSEALARIAAAALGGPDSVSMAGASAGAAAAADGAGLSPREALTLALLEQHGQPELAAAGAPGGGEALRAVLCGHAAALFQGRRYAAAAEFYSAAVVYAEDVSLGRRGMLPRCSAGPRRSQSRWANVLSKRALCMPEHAGGGRRLLDSRSLRRGLLCPAPMLALDQAAAKAVLCRCLALCHMGLAARGLAAEFVKLSEEYQPCQVTRSTPLLPSRGARARGGPVLRLHLHNIDGCSGPGPTDKEGMRPQHRRRQSGLHAGDLRGSSRGCP